MADSLDKLRNGLLRVSQGLLASPDFKHRRTFQRFFKCQRTPYVGSDVEVRFSPSQQKAHFGNVVRCGSVWLCPDCSSKISVVRCNEIKTAISNWTSESSENAVYMLTLTHSHSRHDNLKSLLSNQSEALERFWRNGSVRRLLSEIGYVGRVSSFEITFGQATGWHPHRHILLFCKKQDDLLGLSCKFRSYWTQALECFSLHGNVYSLDIQGGAFADQYITKLANEVSLSNLKRSRSGERYTPFSLLSLIKEKRDSSIGWAILAFREYALATRGRHQFSWSRGLKLLLSLDDVDDLEIASEEPSDSYTLVRIPNSEFKKILRSFNKYHDLLEVAKSADSILILRWLREGGFYGISG